jgi:hypothetical protein
VDRRERLLASVAAIIVAAASAGCAGNAGDAAQLRQQANAALARWADAVAAAGGPSPVVLVGELTSQVGEWEEAVGENYKVALMAGRVEPNANLPAEVPPDGEVRWPGGFTASVALVSAQQAFAAIQGGAAAPCGDCTSLRITGSRLTTGSIETSRGPATGPIWEYTVQGTAVKVTRVAIAHPITVTPPLWDPNNSPVGLAIDSASGSVGGRELTVTFLGAPLPADQPCGEDYTAEAIESELAVVVIVTRHPHGGAFGACTLAGAVRTATAELAGPLGERAVLEVRQGLPVPVVLSP